MKNKDSMLSVNLKAHCLSRIKSLFKYYDTQSLKTKKFFAPVFVMLEPARYLSSKKKIKLKKSNLNLNFEKLNPKVGFKKLVLPNLEVEKIINNAHQQLANRPKNDKPYLRALTDIQDYSPLSPEFKIASNPNLIALARSYFGHTPYLYDLTVLHSPKINFELNHDNEFSGSQLFHRDGDDLKSLKVWILCTEVKNEHGPTTLIDAQTSEKISRGIKYKQEKKIPYNVESTFKLNENSIFQAIGKPGTTYITDTVRLLHFGSRVKVDSERLVFMIHYVTFYSCYFRKYAKRGRRKMLHEGFRNANLNHIEKEVIRGYLN